MDTLAITHATMGRTHRATTTRMRARLVPAVAVLAFALVSGGARADAVTDWDVIAFDTFKAANG